MADDLKQELDALQQDLLALRIAYDNYFNGVERREPLAARERLSRALQALQAGVAFQTAARFRLQTLKASFLSLEVRWTRLAQQLEDGVTGPEARTQARPTAPVSAAAPAKATGAQTDGGSAAPEPPVDSRRQEAPASGAPDDAGHALPALVALHRDYTAAQPPGSRPVSLQALAAAVEKQTQAIKKQYSCAEVHFRVEVKDGRPVLKATPR